MPTAYLTRIVEFTATHRFPQGPEFGAAAQEHGHRYECHVTVRGPFDPGRAGVMSLKAHDAGAAGVERAPHRHVTFVAMAVLLSGGAELGSLREPVRRRELHYAR